MRIKNKYIYALSFLLPFITLFCGMIYFEVAPFGDKSLLIIDGLHQYTSFFSILYDKLHSGENLFYSFRTGLGINFLSLFSYYLSSPLNILIVFFSRDGINMVVSWLIVLKLSLSGLTASIYFTSRSKKPGIPVIALSCAYALNGYMVGYCWNVMWLDAILIFPLILMGIERLIDKKDGRLYCLALFYALYCNYYIAFMICIFSVIWYLFYHFTSMKQFFFRGIAFSIYSLLAAGLAAIILIPAYVGIKQTASGTNMALPSHLWIGNFWNLLERQFDLAYPITHDNFDGNANLYFGMFSLLFLMLYLLNREIRLSDKIKRVILVIFFFVSFNEQILNFIWHGFHNQYGIPNRFSFLYGFILLEMGFEVFEHKDAIRKWQIMLSYLAAMALLVVTYWQMPEPMKIEVLLSAGFLISVYFLILLLDKVDDKRKLFYETLLPTLMTGEILVSSLLGFDTNGQISISKFFYATKDMERAIADADDGTFFRSEVAVNNFVDESCWYPMNGISLFGSTAKDTVVDRMNALGFNTGCNEYLYKGGTPLNHLMFNLRYLYYHETDDVSNEFYYVDQYGSMSLHENPTPGMSLAYGIRDSIMDWNYTSDYPFRVQNSFCETGYGVEQLFSDVPIPEPMTNGCEATPTNDGEYFFEYKEKADDSLTFVMDFPQGAENLYFFFDGTQVDRTEIAINGQIVEQGDFDGTMKNLGHLSQGAVVQIKMSLKGEQTTGYIRLSAADLTQEKYDQLVDAMTRDSLRIYQMSDNQIKAEFTAEDWEYIFFSIPYDEGWTVTVDGEEVETFPIGEAFLAIAVEEGDHDISLTFLPGGYSIGWKITLVSIILFILLCVYTRRRLKKELLQNEIQALLQMTKKEEVLEEDSLQEESSEEIEAFTCIDEETINHE